MKLTTEPPKGLPAKLLAAWLRDPLSEEKFFASCKRPRELRTLSFALSFFHALVQERQQFGSLGWNVPYGFNDSDFRVSLRQLHLLLNEPSAEIPYKVSQLCS